MSELVRVGLLGCGNVGAALVALVDQQRDAIAAVFGLTRDQIMWGHKTPIQHIYGHGPG